MTDTIEDALKRLTVSSAVAADRTSAKKKDHEKTREKPKLVVSSAEDQKLSPCIPFKKLLDTSPFSIFACVADLGYYGWSPNGGYKRLDQVTTKDMSSGIILSEMPTKVSPARELNRQCPMSFRTLPPQEHRNQFPYDPSYLAPLHVAISDRMLDPATVHFMFGGSTLNMLATREISSDCKYLAQVVPGTSIVVLAKHKEYVQNFSDPGFQFERLVSGGRFQDVHDETIVEHLHVMDIGDQYRVLFSAECDGSDDHGHPVEVKASNPRYWGTKVMFQMMSSGSLTLYAGSKRGMILNSIQEQRLDQVMDNALCFESANKLERNILEGMRIVQEALFDSRQISKGQLFEVVCSYGTLKLRPYQSDPHALLPPNDVVEELVQVK